MLSADSRRLLLETALTSVHHGLLAGERGSFVADPQAPGHCARLNEPGNCFVTLLWNKELRGCCGVLEPERPLIEDVWHNAYSAAFLDPRFRPLSEAEIAGLVLHISILSPLEELFVRSRNELIAVLAPGQDGLVLQWRQARVTFIPAVWESLPNPHSFLLHLMRKAGLPDNFWAPDLRAWRYEVESIP